MDSAVEQMYQSDIGSRGKLGRMSFYKKGGKGTSPLGKKYMTDAEINKNHGPVHKCDLNGFMTFSEFHNFSADTQRDWINSIQDKYDVGLLHISRVVFKLKDDQTLKGYLQMQKILKSCNPDKRRRKTGLEQLKEDVRNWERGIVPFSQYLEDIPKFMSWEQFKELKPDEKVIFINRIVNEYRIGMATIEHILWESKTQGNLRYVLIREKIYDKFEISKSVTRNYKEGRERFERDVTAWKQAILANDIATVTPVCDNEDVDLTLVDRLKNAMVGDKPVQFQVYDAITESWYATKDEVEENMKPIPKFSEEHQDILEGPIDLQVIEPSNKAQIGTKFEFVREYTGRKIDVDQLMKLNDMTHYLEEGKELHIRIEVRTVDNS